MKNKNAFIVVIVFILAIFLYARFYYKPIVVVSNNTPVIVQDNEEEVAVDSKKYVADYADIELKPKDQSANPFIYESKKFNVSFSISSDSSGGGGRSEVMTPFVIEDKDGIYLEVKNKLTGEVNLFRNNNYKEAESSILFYPLKDPKNAKAEMIEKIKTETGNSHCTLFNKPGSLVDGFVVDDRMNAQQAADFIDVLFHNDDGAIFAKYPQFKNLNDICLAPKGYYFPVQFSKDNTRAYMVVHPTQAADFYGDSEHKIWWHETIKVK